jgi:ethanolamine ammonia-lyase small subunit
MIRKVAPNLLDELKVFTPARIAIGATGTSIPSKAALDFAWAHAAAKDALNSAIDYNELAANLEPFFGSTVQLKSKAQDREDYLLRPDLGRVLCDESREELQQWQSTKPYDLVFVLADGLSPAAIQMHVLPFFAALFPLIASASYHIAPACFANQARVALGDGIAQNLQAKLVVVLIGERPGLSAPNSMSLYITYSPKTQTTDAQRNCISNIQAQGLSYETAAQQCAFIIEQALQRQETGIHVKNTFTPNALL